LARRVRPQRGCVGARRVGPVGRGAMMLMMTSREPERVSKYKVVPEAEPENLAKLSSSLRLLIERMRGGRGGLAPKWVNLDGEVNNVESIRALDRAMRDQKPKCSIETLSLRYCRLSEEALQVLVALVATNKSLETLYLHLTVVKQPKVQDAIAAGWGKHGLYHRVKNAGQTLFRKVDASYLKDRMKFVPAWAMKPPAKEKKKKGKKKGKKKK
jgi:hypothetical protein